MFTGIVTDIGEVAERDEGRIVMKTRYDPLGIAVGASIACDGCCLTVTGVEARDGGALFSVDASNETLSRTTLGAWTPGRKVNLERALRAGDELGGHLVTGHVDERATIAAAEPDGDSLRFAVAVPPGLAKFIAPKGSVTLDGVSLTVNAVEGGVFGVNVIPHTLAATTWSRKRAGDDVNLEADVLARYVARHLELRA